MTKSLPNTIAYFITPHGYGHAARACAIMAKMQALDASIRFEIFTTVPRRFFEDSLAGDFRYHPVVTDIGLVQSSPLAQDLEKTLAKLDDFLPFSSSRIQSLATQISDRKCRLILCDIAPLGIAVALAAGVPSVLLENFTWDWIYQGLPDPTGRLKAHIDYLAEVFQAADYRIQLEPVCRRDPAAFLTRPVSRRPRTPAGEVRQALGIPKTARLVLITMGGIPLRYGFLDLLNAHQDIYFIIPGASETIQADANRVLLPHHSNFFHPDLAAAADAIIGKAGYSTLAEVYHAGIPFGYVPRPDFRESDVLTAYIQKHLKGFAIGAEAFETGCWITRVPELLDLPRLERSGENGAVQAARVLLENCGLCTK